MAFLAARGRPTLDPEQRCQSAAYRLDDGRILDTAPSEGKDLRWRLSNGRSGRLAADNKWTSTLGWTAQPDGVTVELPACRAGDHAIRFSEPGGPAVHGVRLALKSWDPTFSSDGTRLFGRLTLPEGTETVPVIIETHGSERDSALDYSSDQRMLPALGIGVFVYNKRGTGRSEGSYTQNFDALAIDAVAALGEARRLAGRRASRVDYKGGSQGRRVAPLAATKAQVDFVIVDYGLPESVADESRDQTVLELARKGYAHADLEAAAEVADATSDVAASHLRTVFERLERVRAKYGSRPWFGELAGPFTGRMLGYPGWVIRLVGPMLDGGTPINYDAMTVLRRVKVPMLWVLAGDDTQAPSTTTQSRLRQLAADGYPVTAVFSPAPITEYSNSRSLPTDPGQRLAILRVISRPPWTLRFEANSTGVRQGQSNRPESRHAGHARSRKPRLTALYGLGGAEVGRYVNDSLDAHPAIQSAPADQPNSVTQWYTIRSRTSDIEFRNRSVRSKLVTST